MREENVFHCYLGFHFIFQRELPMVVLYALRCMHLPCWLPHVVTFRVPLPFDEVLEGSRPASTSVVDHAFHDIFLFPSDKVRWWLRVVGSVRQCFMIG